MTGECEFDKNVGNENVRPLGKGRKGETAERRFIYSVIITDNSRHMNIITSESLHEAER